MKKVAIVVKDCNGINEILLRISLDFDIVSVLTDDNTEMIESNFVIHPLSKIRDIIDKRVLLIVIDNNNELASMLNRSNILLCKHWIPWWLIDGSIVDVYRLFLYVKKDKSRFKECLNYLCDMKKVIIFHGNCQMVAISHYLNNLKTIHDEYFIIKLPCWWDGIKYNEYVELIDCNIFFYADFLLIQTISESNKFGVEISTENILSYVNDYCKIIRIPNIYSSGYYPQFDKEMFEDTNIEKYVNEDALKVFKNVIDYNILGLVKEGKDVEEIVQIISDPLFYSEDDVLSRIIVEMKMTETRENNLDVKMVDYLKENYFRELLFESTNHPTESVFIEEVKRILPYIGIVELDIPRKFMTHAYGLPGDERIPVYPSVLKILGLEKYYDYFYKLPTGKKVKFQEYMRAYIQNVYVLDSI